MAVSYRKEQHAIRRQVFTGRRCCQCLRPFNLGERKHLALCHPHHGMLCAHCYARRANPTA